jgi:flagellar biosynthesis/type III secretory pathway protein FliH
MDKPIVMLLLLCIVVMLSFHQGFQEGLRSGFKRGRHSMKEDVLKLIEKKEQEDKERSGHV